SADVDILCEGGVTCRDDGFPVARIIPDSAAERGCWTQVFASESRVPSPESRAPSPDYDYDVTREGWTGWDAYAPFYDWENARTLGRKDVPFWRDVATQTRGPVLELGCGTGRISLPLARAGVRLVGVDRSAQMLARASRRVAALRRKRTGHR